jgi:hypothetical protein
VHAASNIIDAGATIVMVLGQIAHHMNDFAFFLQCA